MDRKLMFIWKEKRVILTHEKSETIFGFAEELCVLSYKFEKLKDV
jgi:hypothetical protein